MLLALPPNFFPRPALRIFKMPQDTQSVSDAERHQPVLQASDVSNRGSAPVSPECEDKGTGLSFQINVSFALLRKVTTETN
jgi:hypothetical protein